MIINNFNEYIQKINEDNDLFSNLEKTINSDISKTEKLITKDGYLLKKNKEFYYEKDGIYYKIRILSINNTDVIFKIMNDSNVGKYPKEKDDKVSLKIKEISRLKLFYNIKNFKKQYSFDNDVETKLKLRQVINHNVKQEQPKENIKQEQPNKEVDVSNPMSSSGDVQVKYNAQ